MLLLDSDIKPIIIFMLFYSQSSNENIMTLHENTEIPNHVIVDQSNVVVGYRNVVIGTNNTVTGFTDEELVAMYINMDDSLKERFHAAMIRINQSNN